MAMTLIELSELHRPVAQTYNSIFASTNGGSTPQITQNYCEHCRYKYPCLTIRAIQVIEKELA